MKNIIAIIKLLFTQKEILKKSLLDQQLSKRRFIVGRSASHFEKPRDEPAPLLGLSLLEIRQGGKSTLAEDLTFRGAEVTVVDIDANAIEKSQISAKKSGADIHFIHGSPKELLEQGKKFDIILCMDLFESVDKLSKFTHLVKNILQANGIIIFSGNNQNFKSFIINTIISKLILKATPSHRHNFKDFKTPQKVSDKLAMHNIEIKEIKGLTFDTEQMRWRKTKSEDAKFIGTAVFKS